MTSKTPTAASAIDYTQQGMAHSSQANAFCWRAESSIFSSDSSFTRTVGLNADSVPLILNARRNATSSINTESRKPRDKTSKLMRGTI